MKSFSEIPAIVVTQETKPKAIATGNKDVRSLEKALNRILPRIPRRELVAGGDIKWKPVDSQAAKMLMKSPEINKPNQNQKPMNSNPDTVATDSTAKVNSMIIKMSNQTGSSIAQFAEEVTVAKQKLDIATDMFRADSANFGMEMPKLLAKTREWRMAMEREVSMSVKALAEIRQFFLNDAHEKEILRLNEFVRTCERLKALADDGTLDKVATIMIKLA